jgi:hypothetical protein
MNKYGTVLLATAYNAFRDLEKHRFVSGGDSFLVNLLVNDIYNPALTRRGINIIQAHFDWNKYIGFIIPGHSI